MNYRLTPRQIEDMYHQCITDGKSADECVKQIQPYIDEYKDPEGVKIMIRTCREERKKHHEKRVRGLKLLSETIEGLRRNRRAVK